MQIPRKTPTTVVMNVGGMFYRGEIYMMITTLVVKVDGYIATPKRWRFVRVHDKPRLMGVVPSTFQVV